MKIRILTVVDLVASEGRNTGSSTSVTNTATLTVLSDGTGTRARGRGAGGSGGSGRVGGGASAGGRAAESGTDGTELDVGVSDRSATTLGLDVGGLARVGGARTTVDTGLGSVGRGGVRRVEPEHLSGVVVPNGESEDHSVLEGITHGLEATESLEVVVVAEDGLLLRAELIGDGVARVDAGDVDLGVLEDLAILDVETTDLSESAGGGVVGGEELSNDGELLLGVNGSTRAKEGLVTHTPGVEVTTILVTNTTVTVVTITTLGT